MEFGWINLFGGIIVVLILIPNIIYALKKRSNEADKKQIPKLLTVCEQIGRYACMILMWLPLLIWKFGFGSAEGMLIYLFLNGILVLAYYLCWIVYSKKPALKSAMALAMIPTVIFLASGLLLRHWLLVAAAVLIGVSHGWITYITYSEKVD